MVNGKTKSGIKFSINENIKDDARLLYYLTKAQTSNEPTEQSNAVFSLLKLIFGSEESLVVFMDAVASTHEGICNTTIMMSEITEMFEAINLKKS